LSQFTFVSRLDRRYSSNFPVCIKPLMWFQTFKGYYDTFAFKGLWFAVDRLNWTL